MPSNVEIKARAGDLEDIRRRAEALSEGSATAIEQEDTFFHAPHGRLKLREFGDGRGELIQYDRPDRAGPKSSDYSIAKTSDAASLKTALTGALGVRGVVRKTRRLLLIGQTRVHLDEVEGLGRFMELEVVLKEGQTEEEGAAIARELMEQLGVRDEDLLEGAYLDLMEQR